MFVVLLQMTELDDTVSPLPPPCYYFVLNENFRVIVGTVSIPKACLFYDYKSVCLC